MIKQGSVAHINSSGPGLGGSYLASSHGILSVKGIENRVEVLLSALQSKSSAVVNDYRLRNWVSYIQESTESIKNAAIPRGLMRPPTSFISGVTTPKASMYRSTKQEDPTTLFPDGITGIAKPGSENSIGTNLSDSFFTIPSDDEILSSKETFLFGIKKDKQGQKYLQDPAEYETNSSILDTKSNESPQLVALTPKKSISTITSSNPLMNGFLKKEVDAHNWLGDGLTGVKGGSRSTNKPVRIPSSTTSNAGSHTFNNFGTEKGNSENASSIMVSDIPTKQSPPPPQLSQQTQEQTMEVPDSVITPPPEEKSAAYVTTPAASKNNPLNNAKKSKRKSKKAMSSTTSGSESGPETIIQSMNPIVDAPIPIAADTK